MKIVVADSGPLIALAGLECLHLPESLWGTLLVPRTVFDECTEQTIRPGTVSVRHAVDAGLIEVVAEADLSDAVASLSLDAGEAQAIDLAQRMNCALLIDEQRGRRAASQLGIPHIGTCGLLVLAKRAALIAQVAPLLGQLRSSGYFLSSQLVADTLRLAGEE